MNHKYYRQIVELLALRPEGLKVSAIAKNIYNQEGNLFADEDHYEKLYESIRQFLWQQSQRKNSQFITVEGKRGYYKLRTNYSIQTEFQFASEDIIESLSDIKKNDKPDGQLELF